ncbi:MAG: efflux RND transporter periplasmic adaptor subunit [Melioribacteraceae bacterium]
MKIKLWIIVISIISVSVIFLMIILFRSSVNEKIDESANVNYDKLNEVVFDVKTEKVKKGDLILYVNANGLIRASEELDLTSNVSGIISYLNIYEGKHVKKGDLLIGLDDREYEIALNDAIARVTDAKVEYGFLVREYSNDTTVNPKAKEYLEQLNKLEKDYAEGKIDETKYNDLKNELDMKLIFTGAKREEVIQSRSGLTSAINAYKRAKLNYEFTKIKAPFDGVIGDCDLVVGQRIQVGQKLCKLLDNSALKIDVGVLENDIPRINIGKNALIEIPSLSSEKFNGRIIYISPYVDKETKTCKVTVLLQNVSNKIKPGMFANVLLEVDNLKDRILIPKEALLVRDKRTLVFAVENNLAKWKYVKIGKENDQYIEIIDGLKPGEEVIVEGHYTLTHDSKVNVIR